ncbi:MAG: DUF4469 domain-containing protein [Tannerella sp.]|jgi:hypothetical protein|nr:DUF4469 domain-containing protein [Tannerella sp.]
MLEYSLHENPLTERNDDFAAQTHVKTTYDREQFIDLMLQRGTLMTKTDAVAVLNNIEETVAYIVRNGGTVNLPLFNTGFSISGVFESALDSFDPHRHHLHVNISKGTLLRTVENEVKLTKVNAVAPQPQILEVKDSVTGKVDEVLTAGGAVEIDGVNIKITGKDTSCGLYFVNSTGVETPAVTFIRNKPATLLALIPDLPADTYHIKIVTQYSSGRDLKEPKTTLYGKPLVVE